MSEKEKDQTEYASTLTGKLLLAMPGLGDPRFEKSVIFICGHDAGGAMGLVINKPLAHVSFDEVLADIGIASDITVNPSLVDMPVVQGGPVETVRGFLLHSNDFLQKDTVKIDEKFSVSGTLEVLHDIAEGKGPEHMLFALGYAGWDADQLESELGLNAWMVAEPTPDIVFHENLDQKWEIAMKSMGIDPLMLSSDAGRA